MVKPRDLFSINTLSLHAARDWPVISSCRNWGFFIGGLLQNLLQVWKCASCLMDSCHICLFFNPCLLNCSIPSFIFFYPLRLNSEKHVASSSRILIPTLFTFPKDVSLGIWRSDNGVNKSVICLSGWSRHTFSTPSSLLPSHSPMQPCSSSFYHGPLWPAFCTYSPREDREFSSLYHGL